MKKHAPDVVVRKMFSLKELQEAHEIIAKCRKDGVQPNATLKREFVLPRIKKAQAKLGQALDATYVAYLVEYYFMDMSDVTVTKRKIQ